MSKTTYTVPIANLKRVLAIAHARDKHSFYNEALSCVHLKISPGDANAFVLAATDGKLLVEEAYPIIQVDGPQVDGFNEELDVRIPQAGIDALKAALKVAARLKLTSLTLRRVEPLALEVSSNPALPTFSIPLSSCGYVNYKQALDQKGGEKVAYVNMNLELLARLSKVWEDHVGIIFDWTFKGYLLASPHGHPHMRALVMPNRLPKELGGP